MDLQGRSFVNAGSGSTVQTGAQADTVYGSGVVTVHTGKGNDHVALAKGSVFTGPGDDVVTVGDYNRAGRTDVALGGGQDRLSFEVVDSSVPAGVVINGAGGTGIDTFDANYLIAGTLVVRVGPHGAVAEPFSGTMTSFENVNSGSYLRGSTSITGSDGTNVIRTASSDDDIEGRGGDDDIDSGDGDDSIDGGEGSDRCVGAPTIMNCEILV